jgi:hypothetical protein
MPATRRSGKSGVSAALIQKAESEQKARGVSPPAADAIEEEPSEVITAPQPTPEPPKPRTEPFGVRGEDFVEIWHSPESPDEQIRISQDRFVKFKKGILVVKDAGINDVIQSASRKGRYVKSDPDVLKPFVCTLCQTPWYSQEVYGIHMTYTHASGMTRK